jgi:UDP-2-acetamido-3-amino-2,3-dideoxy-glucuronate N-acetyltransferase
MEVKLTKKQDELVNCTKHETAIIDLPCRIGEGTLVWHWTHIRENCKIGNNCSFGQNCYVANGVTIGDNVRVQNNVSIYEGVVIEDDVFIGPSVVFTNIRKPWSTKPNKDFEVTLIKRGASIGANATILCGVTVGEGALIGMGSVVNKNVPPRTLVVGNPARVIKQLGE